MDQYTQDLSSQIKDLETQLRNETLDRDSNLIKISEIEGNIHIQNSQIKYLQSEIARTKKRIESDRPLPIGWSRVPVGERSREGDYFNNAPHYEDSVFVLCKSGGKAIVTYPSRYIRPKIIVNWDKIPEELNFVARNECIYSWHGYSMEPKSYNRMFMRMGEVSQKLLPSQCPSAPDSLKWQETLIQRPTTSALKKGES